VVQSEVYERLVNKFGKEHQLIVFMSEMSECISEISRRNIPDRHADEQDLLNEIADVVIMTEQMRVVYGDRLITAIHKKLNKAKTHLVAK
jgi:NTP pyrophosphatase (non-canonical NTP hydrolase)